MFDFSADEMNVANEELRGIIKNMWPNLSPKMLDLFVPPNSGENCDFTLFSQSVWMLRLFTILFVLGDRQLN